MLMTISHVCMCHSAEAGISEMYKKCYKSGYSLSEKKLGYGIANCSLPES